MTRLPLPVWIERPLRRFYHDHVNSHATRSYSQEGEDMILRRIFEKQTRGFYVDVGAHHPRRFSNTCHFYENGWSGINIEPNPDGFALLERARKRDINIQCGVSSKHGTLVYSMFDEPALNTFDPDIASQRAGTSLLLETREVRVEPLTDILDNYIPRGTAIDFMNIDVEGHDLVVLRSNNWTRYRARVVIAESIGSSLDVALNSDITRFMLDNGYSLFAKTVHSIIFQDNSR